jgi:chemotaxis protein CheD
MDERRSSGLALDGVLVKPGEMALALDGSTMVSVVGSGVVVCLWSGTERIAALAHFVEPEVRDPDRATARYGNAAIPEIVRMVRSRGRCAELEAQLFGGAQENEDDGRGVANAEMAQGILARLGVSVASKDLGGSKGRKVIFDGSTGQIAVVKVHQLRSEDWRA